jgi:hypothetical protein
MSEFPDFDEVLPDLVPLVDWSWHNDTCPNFGWRNAEDPDLKDIAVMLHIDYLDPDKREVTWADMTRFSLFVMDENTSEVVTTPVQAETWDELRAKCNDWCFEHVGYRPDDEGAGPLPIGQLVLDVGQMAFFHSDRRPNV